jgi:hypothetical protein
MHSAAVFLPAAFHAPIGLVIATWGQFEETFDAALCALISGESQDGGHRNTGEWQNTKFKRRQELFKSICAEWLASWRPNEATSLNDLLGRAADLHWRRNMIAHGRFVYSILPHSSTASNFRAISVRKNREMPIDEEKLKKLHHDIAHLTGELAVTFKRIGTFEGPVPVFADDDFLRIYRETIHPWNADPNKRSTAVASNNSQTLQSVTPVTFDVVPDVQTRKK